MLLVIAVKVIMFAIYGKCRLVQRAAKHGRAAFADVASAADRVARLTNAGIEARVGYVLVRAAEVADRIAFGVDRRHQRRVAKASPVRMNLAMASESILSVFVLRMRTPDREFVCTGLSTTDLYRRRRSS